MSFISAILLVILGTLIGAFGALFLKLAANKKKKIFLTWEFLTGGILYFLSTIPFLIAVKFVDVTNLYPFVATSYIWVVIISKIILKENVNIWKTAGILFIMCGIILTGLGRTQ